MGAEQHFRIILGVRLAPVLRLTASEHDGQERAAVQYQAADPLEPNAAR